MACLVIVVFFQSVPSFARWPARVLLTASASWLIYLVVATVRSMKFDIKKTAFSLVIGLFLYVAIYLICHVFIQLMSVRDESVMSAQTDRLTDKARIGIQAMLDGSSPVQHDPDIGWVHRPGYAWSGHTISEQGLRGLRVYPETPADPEKRILCIGDSFTFGYEVADDQCYPAHGERLCPGTEWINLGLCGAGLAQMREQYLKNGRRFGGKYVVIGFMTNNQKRTVNAFRAFIAPGSGMTPFTKPFAKVANGIHSIEPNPYQTREDYVRLLGNEEEELAKLRELDFVAWSRQHASANPVARTLRYVMDRFEIRKSLALLVERDPEARPPRPDVDSDPYGESIWHPDSLAFQAVVGTFDLLHREIVADGRIPLFVILPSAQDVEERAGRVEPLHRELLAYFRERGYRHFDFLDTLEKRYGRRLGKQDLYVGTHFNGATNRLLAKQIIKALRIQ